MWNKVKCTLCGGTQTLSHVLSGCKEALGSGRYTWRHNQVLGRLVEAVECVRSKAMTREDKAAAKAAKRQDLRVGSCRTQLTGKSVLTYLT